MDPESIPKRQVNLKVETGKSFVTIVGASVSPGNSFDFQLQEIEASEEFNKPVPAQRVMSAALTSGRFATTGQKQPMSSVITKKNSQLRKDRPSSFLH